MTLGREQRNESSHSTDQSMPAARRTTDEPMHRRHRSIHLVEPQIRFDRADAAGCRRHARA